MKRPTMTIGIPAYNESATIAYLLADILRQNETTCTIKEILIASDGSTDNTCQEVELFKDERIQVFRYNERKGKAFRINQLIQKATGDILVLFDADIVITDPQYLEQLIAPILCGKADMTSSSIRELAPRTLFESVLSVSMHLKNCLFSSFKKGNNMYTCHGPARAFSRNIFSILQIPVSEGEDMYTYLFCKSRGFRYRFVPKVTIDYRLPSTFTDHKKQSLRYIKAQELCREIFGSKFVQSEISIPWSLYGRCFIKQLPFIISHLPQLVFYLCMLKTIQVLSRMSHHMQDMWNVTSSKALL